MQLSAIHIYPIKSCGGLSLNSSEIGPRGLKYDREWLITRPDGRFLTARAYPKMLLIQALPDEDGLSLSAPGMPDCRVSRPNAGHAVPAKIWKDDVSALPAAAEVSEWISTYMGFAAQLVYAGPAMNRPITAPNADPGDFVNFADSCPILIISEASLNSLNESLEHPVPMSRFRPNIVLEGATPYAEDHWQSVKLNSVPLVFSKRCERCVLTTIDPETASKDPNQEPLRTLLKIRRIEKGADFGSLYIPRSAGVVSIGDPAISH